MKRFRFELVAIALFSVLIGLAALAPTSAHAESGCLDQDRAIFANTIFNLGYQCEVSGDVEMQIPGGSYQRLYDDDDSATALLVRCTNQYGCSARTNPYGGAYVSARDTATMVVDTFKFVPGLRYMDAKCFPVDCGVTRYFPQLSWPYYTSTPVPPAPASRIDLFGPGYTVYGGTVWINGSIFCTGCIFTASAYGYVINGNVVAPSPTPVPYTRFRFTANTPVMGGFIYYDNGSYVGHSCFVIATRSGWVDGGSVWPQFYPGVNIRICGDTNPE